MSDQVSWIPGWLYEETPRYYIMRGMLGLAFIVLVVLGIVLWQNWTGAAEDETPETE